MASLATRMATASVRIRHITLRDRRLYPVAYVRRDCRRTYSALSVLAQGRELNLERVLLVTKLSRYEYERRYHPQLNEAELAASLAARGSMYATLKVRHDIHQQYVEDMISTLEGMGSQVRKVTVSEYDESCTQWPTAIMSAGGDGTFLLASSCIYSTRVPLIGVNTDAERSHGHLCLRTKNRDRLSFDQLLDRLLQGQFRWTTRQRIRITMIDNTTGVEHRLPKLSLNEAVFCERDSARPTYYQLVIDDSTHSDKHKCSGLLCSTGTGSTAWMYALRKIRKDDARAMLDVLSTTLMEKGINVDLSALDPSDLAHRYNQRFIFPPDTPLIEFAAREPIENGIFAAENYHGFARKLTVQSRSVDAELVIDGAASYKWVDGDTAILEILPEDALVTLNLTE